MLSIGEHRVTLARRNIRDWLKQAGLPYRSPHKFRHGHIHYGLAHAKDIADFKAVSMNAMHSSMEITDQFYSVLNDDEVSSRIGKLGKDRAGESEDEEAIRLLKEALANLEKRVK